MSELTTEEVMKIKDTVELAALLFGHSEASKDQLKLIEFCEAKVAEVERLQAEIMLRNVILDDCFQRLPSDNSTLDLALAALSLGDEQEDATEGQEALNQYRRKVLEGTGE